MNSHQGWNKLHWLPIAAFTIMLLSILTTYVMAVSWDHVELVFPYISETGTIPPESCFFGQFINSIALLLFLVLYIRYRQISEFIALRPGRIPAWANTLSAVIGVVGLIGLDVVANFQQSSVFVIHVIGAIANFSAGTVYFCMQTWFTKKMLPEIGTASLVIIRAALCCLCVFFTTLTIAGAAVSIKQFQGKDRMKWRPEDGGYGWHVVSTVSEWLLILVFSAFALAFTNEFRFIVMHSPAVTLTNVASLKVSTDSGNVLKNI